MSPAASAPLFVHFRGYFTAIAVLFAGRTVALRTHRWRKIVTPGAPGKEEGAIVLNPAAPLFTGRVRELGRTTRTEWQHATDEEMADITRAYDSTDPPYIGHWINTVVSEHVRVITENLGNRQYCTRSLMRSVLVFETLEELEEQEYWKGRLYRMVGDQLITLMKSEDVGDTEFRQWYKSLGGSATW